MQAVLISINPKWCEYIASGKKTVEVRKTKPKIDVPFKCYIYCTKGETIYLPRDIFGKEALNGKVIGEFVCDKIYNITPHEDIKGYTNQYITDWEYGTANACLTFDEMNEYLKGKNGYGWHISELKIYDKPRELGEFKAFCKSYYDGDRCDDCKYFIDGRGYEFDESDCGCNGAKPIERPPQSWMYVEVSE